MSKPRASSYLPIHYEIENLCFVSVLKLVFELQQFFVAAVAKEFTDDLCSVSMPSLSSTEVYMLD